MRSVTLRKDCSFVPRTQQAGARRRLSDLNVSRSDTMLCVVISRRFARGVPRRDGPTIMTSGEINAASHAARQEKVAAADAAPPDNVGRGVPFAT
jgi:hypothetical protein